MVTSGPLTSVPPAAPAGASADKQPQGAALWARGQLGRGTGVCAQKVPTCLRRLAPRLPPAPGPWSPAPGPRLPHVSPAFLSCLFMMWFNTFRLRVILLRGPLHSGWVVSESCRPLGVRGQLCPVVTGVSPQVGWCACSVTLGVWKHLPLFLPRTKGHVLRVTHTQCVRVRGRREVPCPFSWALWGGERVPGAGGKRRLCRCRR